MGLGPNAVWFEFLNPLKSTAYGIFFIESGSSRTVLRPDLSVLRRAAHGIALVQRDFVAQDLAAGRWVQVFPQEMRTEAGYYLVCPRKQRQPEAVADVRRWLGVAGRSASA